MPKTIFETLFANRYNLELLAKHGATELQSKVTLDMDQAGYLSLIKSVNPLIRSPMSEAFVTVRSAGLLDNICYISAVSNKHVALPEIVTIDDLTIYGKKVPAVKQDRFKGGWTNISHMVKAPKDRYSGLQLEFANEAMAASVRSLLCMAYEDSVGKWLSPRSQQFLIETYAQAMAAPIVRVYSMDNDEASLVRYAFAYYYATLLTDSRDDNGAPDVINRCTRVLKYGKISAKDMAMRMANVVDNARMDMTHVAEFISSNGPSRAKDIEASIIYRGLYNNARNNVATAISADYPPYLAYLLLRVASNDKHPMFTNTLNLLYTRQQAEAEALAFARDAGTFSGIKVNG